MAEPEAQKKSDSLLECLVWLTKHFGEARSASSLIAGLPYDAVRGMYPDLFIEASTRSGYKTRAVERALLDIPAEVFPVVLILKGDTACIAVKMDGANIQLWKPATGQMETVALADLKPTYSGYAIFVKPDAERREEDAEGVKETDYTRHWFWSVMYEHRAIYYRVLVCAVLINLFMLVSPLFIMNVYNRVLPSNAIETGWVLGLGALSVFVFDMVVRTLRGYFIDVAGRIADVVLSRRLFDKVLDMRLGSGRMRSTGVFANSIKEFESIRDFYTSATLTALVDFPFSILFLIIVWLIAGSIAAALLVLYILVLGVSFLTQEPVKRLVQKAVKTAEAKHGLLVEVLNSLETIKGVSAEGRMRAIYGRQVAENAKYGQQSRFYSGFSVHFSGFAQQASSIIIVLIGMYLVRDHELTVGALIASVMLAGRAIAPIGQVSMLVNRYYQSRMALMNLNRIMAFADERPASARFLSRPDLTGAFELKVVDFNYPDAKRMSLQGVSLRIAAGEKIALAGRVGSGKSTLIKLLMNFYEAETGTIMVDGTDIRQVDPADLRRNIAYVGQDTVLLSGTIRENIIMGKPDATDAEILKAAEMSGAHEFIKRHPMGYDMPVGERGQGLSGGQRQSIAMARALILDAPILICDEPTNAMDSATEDHIIKGLLEFTKGKTLILVTHRPSLLRLVDRLVVMDQGKVVADGQRDTVMAALSSGKVAVPVEM